MKFSFVKFAVVLMYGGEPLLWFGLPFGEALPGLIRWLEEGVQDL